MDEPIRRSMANGPTQKVVKKYRMANSINENEELDDETREWLRNKQYPVCENEDNQKSNKT